MFNVPIVPLPQRICSWCDSEIAPGTQPASFGICAPCYVHLEKIERTVSTQARMLDALRRRGGAR